MGTSWQPLFTAHTIPEWNSQIEVLFVCDNTNLPISGIFRPELRIALFTLNWYFDIICLELSPNWMGCHIHTPSHSILLGSKVITSVLFSKTTYELRDEPRRVRNETDESWNSIEISYENIDCLLVQCLTQVSAVPFWSLSGIQPYFCLEHIKTGGAINTTHVKHLMMYRDLESLTWGIIVQNT